MCIGGDTPAPPPPPQEAKSADTVQAMRQRRQAGGMSAAPSTMLTGTGGAPVAPTSLSKPSLLGQ